MSRIVKNNELHKLYAECVIVKNPISTLECEVVDSLNWHGKSCSACIRELLKKHSTGIINILPADKSDDDARQELLSCTELDGLNKDDFQYCTDSEKYIRNVDTNKGSITYKYMYDNYIVGYKKLKDDDTSKVSIHFKDGSKEVLPDNITGFIPFSGTIYYFSINCNIDGLQVTCTSGSDLVFELFMDIDGTVSKHLSEDYLEKVKTRILRELVKAGF